MNVTRDVVRDLLTLYVAGEASEDTRKFVEEYLKTDPALARDAEAARGGAFELPATFPPAPTAEKEALEATRQLLKSRTACLVLAILFTLLPFATVFENGRVRFLLIRDAPVIGIAWWATAAAMWACYFWLRRRLRVSGL